MLLRSQRTNYENPSEQKKCEELKEMGRANWIYIHHSQTLASVTSSKPRADLHIYTFMAYNTF